MPKQNQKPSLFLYTLPAIIISAFLALSLVFAWTEPGQAPPGGNVAAPINVGSATQDKAGWFTFQGGGTRQDTFLATTSGNVGIGTTSPGAKLEVQPNVKITNSLGYGIFMGAWGSANAFNINPAVVNGEIYFGRDTEAKKWVFQSGNVGIGTTTPGAKLEVAGQIKITGGTPGANKVLTSDATGLASWQTLTGTLPSGTSGQTLRHDGTNWVANSNIFNDGTNVGIRTISPAITLAIGDTDTGLNWISDGNLAVYTNNAERMRINSAGNVGIGDTSPASLLTVGSGDLFQVNSSGNLVKIRNIAYSWPAVQGGANTFLKNDGTGALSWTAAGNVGGSGTDDWIPRWNGTNALENSVIYQTNGGNIGIGTVTPEARLEVQSNITTQPYAMKAQSTFAPTSGQKESRAIGGRTYDNIAEGSLGRAWYVSSDATFRMGVNGFAPTPADRKDTNYNYAGYFMGDVAVVGDVRVGIGTNLPRGALDVVSITGGLIVPSMTRLQRDALTPVNGMIIYNTIERQFNFYENGAWVWK